eukprot:g1162.t1
MIRILFTVLICLRVTTSRDLRQQSTLQASKAGSSSENKDRWTYNPTSSINEIVALNQPNKPPPGSGKAPSKGGKDTRQHKATNSCCQICPYKFHNTLALLEISEDLRSATASRFKEWHESFKSNKANIGKGTPGYPGVWTCPSIGEPNKDNPTVCCDFCPSENYPDMDYELSMGTKPTPTKEEAKMNPNNPDEGCPVASKCGSDMKPGTICDPNRIKCPLPPKPFPGTSAPCCSLCPEAFVPFQNDPMEATVGETPEIKTKSFKADEFGYVMPDLKFLEIRSKMMTTTIVRDEIITNKKATKDDEAKSNVRRCCYPCSAAEYNKSPGDAVFGEPQSEENRLRDLFRPLNMPYKNFENRRAYADGNTAKTGSGGGK